MENQTETKPETKTDNNETKPTGSMPLGDLFQGASLVGRSDTGAVIEAAFDPLTAKERGVYDEIVLTMPYTAEVRKTALKELMAKAGAGYYGELINEKREGGAPKVNVAVEVRYHIPDRQADRLLAFLSGTTAEVQRNTP